MSIDTIIALLGLLGTVVVAMTGQTRWMLGRIRDSDKDRSDAIKELHKRIDDTRDRYIRRDEVIEHLRRFEEALSRIETRLSTNK